MVSVRAVLVVVLGLGGCAQGVCATCPTASLTANGSTELSVHVGDAVVYEWSSANADAASSTVAMSPSVDRCGEVDGPWVVATLQGTTGPDSLLACQAGTIYTLDFTVSQSSTGVTASSIVTITVN